MATWTGAADESDAIGERVRADARLAVASDRDQGRDAPIVLIFEENQDYASIVGNLNDAPFINGTMIAGGFLATDYWDVAGWGSKPNYIAATSGVTGRGLRAPYRVENLFDQLQTTGHSQRSYEEGMPRPGFLKGTYGSPPGNYDKTHDPAAYYTDIVRDHGVCMATLLPAGIDNSPSGLIADAEAGVLADVNFVTPNDCDNMHSCSIATGDAWLSQVVPPIVAAGATVILTWDEGSTDGHVVFVEYGANVRPGTRYTQRADHYSLLAGLEDQFSLPRLGKAVGATPLPV